MNQIQRFAMAMSQVIGVLLALGVQPASAQSYEVLTSASPARTNPGVLDGASVSGDIYVFASPETDIDRVTYWVNDVTMAGSPHQVENLPPYDLSGGQRAAANPFDANALGAGGHTITALLELVGGGSEVITASFSVSGGGGFDLRLSSAPNRSNAGPLEGAQVLGDVYVFAVPAASIDRVTYWVDDTSMSGPPAQVENSAPFDLNGGSSSAANPLDTRQLGVGTHTVTALLEPLSGSSQVITATFTVEAVGGGFDLRLSSAPNRSNAGPLEGAQVSGDIYVFAVPAASIDRVTYWVDDTSMSGPPAQVENSAPFDLNGGSSSAANPFDARQSGVGTHTVTALLEPLSGSSQVITATFTVEAVGGGSCEPISPLPCSQIRIDLPFSLEWTSDEGGVTDGAGSGLGFTMVAPPSSGAGYVPGLLDAVFSPGQLEIATTSGLFIRATNSQENLLGVGINVPSQISVISTTLSSIPLGSGNFEQGGLWFGNDEDNLHKLVVISKGPGVMIEHVQEIDGSVTAAQSKSVILNEGDEVTLRLSVNPFDRTISGEYAVNEGSVMTLGAFSAPGELFSFDQANIDPVIGTDSFAGVFASHRNGPISLVYTFNSFTVIGERAPPVDSDLGFTRMSHAVPFPTSMVWGKDSRLYVTELFGIVHALTYDADRNVIDDESINTLGSRLTLGITEDPGSTPGNVILWLAHSSPSSDSGAANSSTISRLEQDNGWAPEDVVTGLPRAIANHAINSIHFGPDGRLYIALGGNTGAGAPNTASTEFGRRPEQPLSAALLVADVNASAFMGLCGTVGCDSGPDCDGEALSWVDDVTGTADNVVPANCDVAVYASGLRNTYDFVHHSNENIYATDNGLGVRGSFPPFPLPDCTGLASVDPVSQGGENPGVQPDLLQRLQQGKYYGHPNPQRNECVFKDGSLQGVAPLPNYEPPLLELGTNLSANGIVEYPFDVGCLAMQGNLLISNFSQGDNITRTRLTPDGEAVAMSASLVGGFDDPLPLAVSPDGTIFVGEFGADMVTSLEPFSLGCWSELALLPQATVDAGGAALDGKLYMVGGKTASSHLTTLRIYDPVDDAWSTGPNLPGPGVENPSVTAAQGRLYVFGGSTGPFSGAVNNAAAFNPTTSQWTTLTPMPTARGGATAQAVGGLIYVAGGLGTNGASLDTVEVYNPLTNLWSTAPSMNSRRDNSGSAVLDGSLYVFGGRIREANGTVVDGTLNSVEMFDALGNVWMPRASMPTGRRAMVVGTLDGRAQIMGGEATSQGATFPQNEEYNSQTDTWISLTPMSVPRHGAAAGTITGRIIVAGGGIIAGGSFSDVTDAFEF